MKIKNLEAVKLGKKGGEATKKKYGAAHYKKIRKIARSPNKPPH